MNTYDNSTNVRLHRLGVLTPNGEINSSVLETFSGIFAGQFMNDLCEKLTDPTQVTAVLNAFSELAARKDYPRIYLMISLQYDRIRKPLPDPVWCLAEHRQLQSDFSAAFIRQLAALAAETSEKEEPYHDKASDSRPG